MKICQSENHLCLLILLFFFSFYVISYIPCRVYDNLVECKSTAPSKHPMSSELRGDDVLVESYVKCKLSIFIKNPWEKNERLFCVSTRCTLLHYFVWLNYSLKQKKKHIVRFNVV